MKLWWEGLVKMVEEPVCYLAHSSVSIVDNVHFYEILPNLMLLWHVFSLCCT